MIVGSRRTFKKHREGNITATFGTDLMLQGVTSIPNLLLRHYVGIGITDEEMMVLLQLLRLRMEEKILHPTPEMLAEYLEGGVARVEQNLASLLKKEILTVTQYYDETQGSILSGYDFEPLFEKLSEAWACAKVKEIEKTRVLLEEQCSPARPMWKAEFGNLVKNFEEEFGRPLSPMEVEQIRQWTEETDCSLVRDALRRAVLMGKHNFKYIDTILLEWRKNNLRTVEAVEEYEQCFQKKRGKSTLSSGRANVKSGINGKSGKADERKKEMIKTLYLS